METQALILMVSAELIITALIVYFFIWVLTAKPGSEKSSYINLQE